MSTSRKKVLFLDIDGPMIPYRAMFLPGQTPIMTKFDPVAVSLLNFLCQDDGWRIVIHSAWIRVYGPEETKKHCIEQGVRAQYFHSDPCDANIHYRYSRVSEWLKAHPDVTTYAIVDDEPYEPDENPEQFPHPANLPGRLVKVNYYDGFMFSTFNEIKARKRLSWDKQHEAK